MDKIAEVMTKGVQVVTIKYVLENYTVECSGKTKKLYRENKRGQLERVEE